MLQNAPMYSYIPAKDVARARKFYEEKLGFKPKQDTAGVGGDCLKELPLLVVSVLGLVANQLRIAPGVVVGDRRVPQDRESGRDQVGKSEERGVFARSRGRGEHEGSGAGALGEGGDELDEINRHG